LLLNLARRRFAGTVKPSHETAKASSNLRFWRLARFKGAAAASRATRPASSCWSGRLSSRRLRPIHKQVDRSKTMENAI